MLVGRSAARPICENDSRSSTSLPAGRFEQQVGKAGDVAQRRAQVVRDRIRKRFEFLVGAAQFFSQFGHLLGALERDAQQRRAELGGHFNFSGVPRQAVAVDGFTPGGKALTRRQLPWRAGAGFLLVRIAGPLDGLHQLGPEPQQIMLVDARDRQRQ